MSNYLSANYLADGMADASPRGNELVNFTVTIVFADGHYTITARRDDCCGVHECHVERYNKAAIMHAVYGVLRKCCGYRSHYRSRYWSVSVYCDVARCIMAQLLPYLPER